jgi:alpha-galactosidase/6-phospho-beta-glucosidase family protein
METIIIALVGAGSRSFGPETVRDVLLSEALTQHRINLRLMDVVPDNLSDIGRCAKSLAEKLGRNCEVSTTTSMQAALDGAQFVVTAVEIERKASSATASIRTAKDRFSIEGSVGYATLVIPHRRGANAQTMCVFAVHGGARKHRSRPIVHHDLR